MYFLFEFKVVSIFVVDIVVDTVVVDIVVVFPN